MTETQVRDALDATHQDERSVVLCHLPLAASIVDAAPRKPDAPGLRRWRALGLREGRRNAMVLDQHRIVADAAADMGLSLRMLRGPEFARAVYPDPTARHNHALRYLVSPDDGIPGLANRLSGAGWSQPAPPYGPASHITRRTGRQKVELGLYPHICPWAPQASPCATLPDADFNAVDILLGAMLEPQAPALRWVCDLVFLFRGDAADTGRAAGVLSDLGCADSAADRVDQVLHLAHANCPSVPKLRQLREKLSGRPDALSRRTFDLHWRARGRMSQLANAVRRRVSSARQA